MLKTKRDEANWKKYQKVGAQLVEDGPQVMRAVSTMVTLGPRRGARPIDLTVPKRVSLG